MSATFQLPSTFTIGGIATQPLIDVAQVRAHVVLLGLFFKLRKTVEAEGQDWVSYIRGAVDRFGEWVQQVDREAYKTPALDVAMVWHTYMLNPLTFASDVGRIDCLKHLDCFPTVDLAKALSATEIMTKATDNTGPALPFGLDLTAAVQRQGGFIEKVDRLGWTADGFFDAVETSNGLISGIARYHAFLDLLTAEPDVAGVPTMDIDLAWHTHQLMGKMYRNDTERLIGHVVDHDDDVEEAGGDAVMEEGFDATAAAWAARFGVAYEGNGKDRAEDVEQAGCRRSCRSCRTSCRAEVANKQLLEESVISKGNVDSAGCRRSCRSCRRSCGAKILDKELLKESVLAKGTSDSAGCRRSCRSCRSSCRAEATENVSKELLAETVLTKGTSDNAGCRRSCRSCRRSCRADIAHKELLSESVLIKGTSDSAGCRRTCRSCRRSCRAEAVDTGNKELLKESILTEAASGCATCRRSCRSCRRSCRARAATEVLAEEIAHNCGICTDCGPATVAVAA